MLLPTLIISDFGTCEDDLRELLPALSVIGHGPDPSKVLRGGKFEEGMLMEFFVEDDRKGCLRLDFGDLRIVVLRLLHLKVCHGWWQMVGMVESRALQLRRCQPSGIEALPLMTPE
jgi:hypothetical protein